MSLPASQASLRRRSPRALRFDLGDFEVDPELIPLLSLADLQALVARHARGDWGSVPPLLRRSNEAFTHPKNRVPGSRAESRHVLRNVKVSILTRQGPHSRRHTRLSLI